MTKTFVLGVGAQKAGTTWLHDHLSANPEADMGFTKEYHVFDVLKIPACHRPAPSLKRRLRLLASRKPSADKFRAWPRSYFEYFAKILESASLTGDITPAYSGLPEETLRHIKTEFNARGVRVAVVFLMRDPVERCWSAVRMHQKESRTTEGVDARLPEEDALRAYFRSEDAEFRTRYDTTIQRIERVFPREDIRYGFYETMFSPEWVADTARFLGMIPQEPDLDRRLNTSPKQIALSEDLAAEVAHHYEGVYRFCAERFPEIRPAWGGFPFLELSATEP